MCKFKAGRHRAADQAIVPLAARHLPLAGWHHQLRHLGLVYVIAQEIALLADRQFQRRAAIEMPDLRRIDAMPARDLTRLEQEIDGGGEGAALAACIPTRGRRPAIPESLAEIAAFRMRLEPQHFDQAIGLVHVDLARPRTCRFPGACCHGRRESPKFPDSYSVRM